MMKNDNESLNIFVICNIIHRSTRINIYVYIVMIMGEVVCL